jgi:hypothetical protein
MTTKVLIVNFGPYPILLRTYAPGDKPSPTGMIGFVHPGHSVEAHVYVSIDGGQGLLVDEAKAPMPEPPK